MFVLWVYQIAPIYAASLPLACAAWIILGINYPRFVTLPDLHHYDDKVELKRAA